MKTLTRLTRVGGASACASLLLLSLGSAVSAQTNTYVNTPLVSDLAGKAPNQDPNLVNPWGLAAVPGDPWWVSDNGTGLSTLYDGQGNIQSLVVTIPPSASSTSPTGTPTGIVANTTTDFGGSFFIFDSEDGTISTWAGAPSATIVVDKGAAAVYKGLTTAQIGSVNVLYAANFRAGTVEVFDTNFNPVTLTAGAFTDPALPAGFAPFNVQAINGNIFVAFAKQDAAKHDEIDGPGLGFVEEFTTSGKLVMRFEHGGYLDAPWGFALAPSNFGKFSNDLLVGNFGSGAIVAYDMTTGKAVGALANPGGKAVAIPGLWAISFGLGGSTGPTDWLYYTAGIKAEAHGLFGYIVAQ